MRDVQCAINEPKEGPKSCKGDNLKGMVRTQVYTRLCTLPDLIQGHEHEDLKHESMPIDFTAHTRTRQYLRFS